MREIDPPCDIYDALKRAVDAIGGAKRVGPRLRPELDAFKARSWLLNCLNDEHAQKFDPPHIFLILRWACAAGYHDAKHFTDTDTGYAPSAPLAPEVQFAEALKLATNKQHEAEESARNLRELIDNPRLMALAKSLHLKIDA